MAPPILPRELVYLPLARIGTDETFRLREVGDVSSLAQSIAQVGQLYHIEVRLVGEVYQPITGFRRLAALRMLLRERVLARVHHTLSDEEAALLAAADSLDSRSLEQEELVAMQERYRERGWSTPALEELIARAIEKAEERREDLEAILLGREPPDRTVEDEDARAWDDLPDEEPTQPGAVVPGHGMQPGSGLAEEVPGHGMQSGSGLAEEVPAQGAPRGSGLAEAAPAHGAVGAQALAGVVPTTGGAAVTAAAETARTPPLDPPLPLPLGGIAPAGREALARDVAVRLADLTLDLGSLLESWQDVPAELRNVIRDQLDYYLAVHGWLDRAG